MKLNANRSLSISSRIFSGILTLSLMFPALPPAYGAGEAPTVTVDPTVQAMQELRDLVNRLSRRLESHPAGKDTDTKRDEILARANKLLADTQNKLAPIIRRAEKLMSEAGDVSQLSSSQIQELSKIQIEAYPLIERKRELMGVLSLYNGEFPAYFLADPAKEASKANVKNALIAAPFQKPFDFEGEPFSPKNERFKSMFDKAGAGVVSFSNQYMIFAVATGFMALAQLQFADASNPNALENWKNQTFNLMGAAGFGMFMMANHKVIHMLNKIESKALPPAMINYLGMSAGTVASELFNEMWTDKDLRTCISSAYNSSTPKKDKEGVPFCKKAYDHWVLNGFVLQYTPGVLSMIATTALAGGLRTALTKAGSAMTATEKSTKLVVQGARVASKANWLRDAATITAGGGVLGPAVAVGDFVIFLAMQTYVTEEPINQVFANFRNNYFDAKAWATNKFGLHSEFLWPKEKTYQLISDALDVEATIPYTAHNYVMDLYKKMNQSGWKKPAPIQACVPTEMQSAIAKGDVSELDKLYFWERLWSRQKSQEQLTCEVYSRPMDLIARYGEVNKNWRQTLLGHFNAGKNNWLAMISQFSTVYDAAQKLARHMAFLKYKAAYKGVTEKPDLSREALAKAIGTQLAVPGGEASEQEVAHNPFWGNTYLRTPELVDYIIAGFACGPDPITTQMSESTWLIPRLYEQIRGYVMQNVQSPAFISTPYGSSLKFIPPKLTTESRNICLFSSTPDAFLNYMTGDRLPDIFVKSPKNPFSGKFFDDKGRTYESLAQYVYDNLNPELYKPVGVAPNFSTWWTEHLINPIDPVWKSYAKVFDRFVADSYAPVLFDRSFRYGCPIKPEPGKQSEADEDGLKPATRTIETEVNNTLNGSPIKTKKVVTCSDGPSAYRVANGVILSLETELRNYLRGLYSLYSATLDKSSDSIAKRQQFLGFANELIENIKVTRPSDFKAADYEVRLKRSDDTLADLISQIAPQLNSLKGDDADFQREMARQFAKQIQAVFAERLEYATVVHSLEFTGGSVTGLGGKTLNSGHRP